MSNNKLIEVQIGNECKENNSLRTSASRRCQDYSQLVNWVIEILGFVSFDLCEQCGNICRGLA